MSPDSPEDAAAAPGQHDRGGPWTALRTFVFRHDRDGALPALLLVLTFGTGMIDATTVLGLGRVFVANMTGNVVFVGLAVSRVPGFSPTLTATSLVGFVAGAFLGGAVIRRRPVTRVALLRTTCSTQAVLVAAAAGVCAAHPHHPPRSAEIAAIALLAVAMGIQNAATRHLAVTGLVTNVLTSTLTSIAAEHRHLSDLDAVRQVASVLALLLGALLGAELVKHFDIELSLVIVVGLLVVVAVSCAVAIRRRHTWGPADT